MSRIRSVHPGLWTDENFVELSIPARLFLIGLWGEADDYGVFEWKPLRLKMRLAPVDDIDAACLLSEITRHGQIVPLMRGDKHYGVIKNFRKFQRPKNPSAPLIALDQEINGIVGLPPGDTPPPSLPQDEPLPTEITPQMEDGMGTDDDGSAPESEHIAATRKLLSILTVDWDDPRWFGSAARVQMWIKRGWSVDGLILPAAQKLMATRGSQGPPNNIAYVEKVIETYSRELARPLPEITNVNGHRSSGKPSRRTAEDALGEIRRAGLAGVGTVESFDDPAGGPIIEHVASCH